MTLIEIQTSEGDVAYAPDEESALVAAETLLDDSERAFEYQRLERKAAGHGSTYRAAPTISFLVEGKTVASALKRRDIDAALAARRTA